MASPTSGTEDEDQQETSDHQSGSESDSDNLGWGNALLDSTDVDSPAEEVGHQEGSEKCAP